MRTWHISALAVTGILLGAVSTQALAQGALPKIGTCPDNYYARDNNDPYCSPNSRAKHAILKQGNRCPANYYTRSHDDAYCVQCTVNGCL